MRIIHCADLHLDSAMTGQFSEEIASQRRKELLLSFEEMVTYARQHQVKAILIAGDLFDSPRVSASTIAVVRNVILANPEISFYYLRGNHDEGACMEKEPVPKNLFLFSEEPKTYWLEDVSITGVQGKISSMTVPGNGARIVMLHGMDGVDFSLKRLEQSGIDYLALGHLHTYRTGPLGEQGMYCYPGCLCGRGFDECGEKGFVLLEIQGRRVSHRFIPFAKRKGWKLAVDITNATNSVEICEYIEQAVKEIPKEDYVSITLVGTVPTEMEPNETYLTMRFASRFSAFQIKNETTLKLDEELLMKDKTIRGEFLRLIKEQEWEESKKRAIATLGLRAIMGEELE
ncbi:DNA repair exonuclease SbcCD nuclease subunit [Lachnospiraceae bacterium XBB1006]|nr:DNA repair exonuclease SbcCD nuclease subunit [Lachnospiraceae bacterium XBB1006]